MESIIAKKWAVQNNQDLTNASGITIKGVLTKLMDNINKDDPRPTIPLGRGDPSVFPSFRTATVAEDAVVNALRSANYNCYSPTGGVLPARR